MKQINNSIVTIILTHIFFVIIYKDIADSDESFHGNSKHELVNADVYLVVMQCITMCFTSSVMLKPHHSHDGIQIGVFFLPILA